MTANPPLQAVLRSASRLAMSARGVATVTLGLLLLALVSWSAGVRGIDLHHMNDYGLISVLPMHIFLALGLLTVGAVVLLRSEAPPSGLLAAYLVALVVMLYAMPILVEDVPRFVVTWVHDGFAEYIRRTGTVAPDLEARFNWPGFFILAAFASQLAGLPDTMAIARWAPVFFNLLYLLPLALIFRSATSDMRLVWAGLWMFELANWIGQDYFSPQALNYFLFLVILSIVLTWFRIARPRSERIASALSGSGWIRRFAVRVFDFLTPAGSEPSPATPRQQAALIAMVVAIFAFVAYSHQLTPFFTVAGLLGLVVFNRTAPRGLPIMLGVMAVGWVSYMTVPFLAGHAVAMIKEIGQVGDTVGSNVVNRIQGSPEHQLVVTSRLVFTLAVWGLAALGALVRWRDGRRDLSLIVLAVAPLPLVGLQAYGGELVLRIYLFMLPFVAFLTAGTVYGRAAGVVSWGKTAVVFGTATVIAVAFLFTRYGNERVDALTTEDVQAVQELYRIAEPGSLLVAADNNLPWKNRDFERFDYVPVTDEVLVGDVRAIADVMANDKYREAYLILTRSEGNYSEVYGGLPPGAWDAFVASVEASPQFRIVYRTQGSVILTRAISSSAPR